MTPRLCLFGSLTDNSSLPNLEAITFFRFMKKTAHLTLTSALIGIASSALTVSASNWPNWRGPNFDGSSDETGYPTTFTKEDAAWKTQLPGAGGSTPIIWENAIFLTSANADNSAILAIRINANTGKIVWSKEFSDEAMRDERTNTAGASAVTDGKLVFFFTGSGDLAAFDFDGNQVWHRNVEEDYGQFAMQWTFSSSPQLVNNILYLQVLQRDQPVNGYGRSDGPINSYLLAMDPATGETKWRHMRDNEAVMESKEAFSTPIPITTDTRDELLIVGADCLTGHNPKTGEELWRWSTYNPEKIGHWRLVPTATYGEGMILICGPKGSPVYGIESGGSGDISTSGNLWTSKGKEVTSDVPSPAFYDGYFYVLNGRNKFITCLHPTTGKFVWSSRIDGKTKIESSPTVVDGKLYFISHLGEVFVYSAGENGGVMLHTAMFGSSQSVNIRSSIVPANRTLYIRTDDYLYAVK